MGLEDRILRILGKAEGKVLPIREIEQKLWEEGQRLDTFAIRDAVWSLVEKRKVDFTPLRHVKAIS